MSSHQNSAARPRQDGFTLVELAVSLGVTVVVMLGILALFDLNNKLTRVQSNVTDMQQSLRIAQYDMVRMIRMAGRGGLDPIVPGQAYPVGAGISILSGASVGTDTYLIAGDSSSPKLLQGTDVLSLRGSFTTPIYLVNYQSRDSFDTTGAPELKDATGGSIVLCNQSPTGAAQDLSALTALIAEAQANPSKARTEALILVSSLNDTVYEVVKLDPAGSAVLGASPVCFNGSGVRLNFDSDRNDSVQSKYRTLFPAPAGANLRSELTRVLFVGLLEEYRFYIREDHAIPGDKNSDLTPVLSRARFYPGTDLPYANDSANLRQDIADGVLDLQFVLGLDRDGDGQVTEDLVNPTNDEWLGNAAGEAAFTGGLKALRVSTLVRTSRPDNVYQAPDLDRIEDHAYSLADAADPVNGTVARLYRRRLLSTIANLRNMTRSGS